jgi:hypothetical protein
MRKRNCHCQAAQTEECTASPDNLRRAKVSPTLSLAQVRDIESQIVDSSPQGISVDPQLLCRLTLVSSELSQDNGNERFPKFSKRVRV